MEDDILLLQKIKEGDEAAFKHLFYQYADGMERFITFYIHDKESAQELTLDIFTSVWEKRRTLQLKLTFKAYLFQAAKNKAYTYLRNHKTESYLEESSLPEQSSEDYPHIEMEELSRLIEEAVSLLPDRCRQIFEQSRMQNLSNKEISQHMNLSEKTVENQLTIALKRIRRFLGDGYSYLW